ncbi:MAG: PLP-dependent transferase [Proteobacteria bacterium]|nr:PLP-dependent transferase [Pseudomonadota bacterium]
MTGKSTDQRFRTLLAKAGQAKDGEVGGVVPPLRLSTTYIRDHNYELPGERLYGRDDNPGFELVEALMCTLEGGADAALFSSGLAAMSAVLATIQGGDVIVYPETGYFGVLHWIEREAERVGFEARSYLPGDHQSLEAAIGEGPVRMVWLESPANPTWEVTSIKQAARLTHQAGGRLVVDATVLTPLVCRPIELGADIVMHSGTKYLNGHSDVVAGILIAAADDEDWRQIKGVRYRSGAILGPFEAWLLLRGMRTMALRVPAAADNALAIAEAMSAHAKIAQVLYPGLPDHPGHQTALEEWDEGAGFTAMLSVRVKGGAAAALKVATSTRLFLPATSLGGVESLIEHRKTVEGETSRVPEDLLRLSIGIEAVDDLIADLNAALDTI